MARTILIVDDSVSMRTVISLALKGAGFETVEACDGKDALAKLGTTKFNMIISDLNMPGMNGIEFAENVRLLPNAKFLPILMLTTEASLTKKEAAKAAGVKAWMSKPFKPESLLTAVNTLCR